MILFFKIQVILLFQIITLFGQETQKSNEFLDKSKVLLPNKKSFQEFENEFRQKYSYLNVPEILVSPQENDSSSYNRKSQQITITKQTLKNESLGDLEWTLLHETGHHNEPYFIRHGCATAARYLIMPSIIYWSFRKDFNLKAKSRLDKFTPKWSSVLKMSTMIPIVCLIMKFHVRPCEHYADNFANKYGSQEALQESYKLFKQTENNDINDCLNAFSKSLKKSHPEIIKKYSHEEIQEFGKKIHAVLNPITYPFRDADHPSPKSRANKIAKALKQRFNAEIQ